MFFVNVQSCSVLNACYIWIRYSVIQSRFLLTMPPFSCRHFLMIFFTRTSIFAWVNTTILLLCINRQLKCCNPAVVRLLTLPKIPAFWHQALAYSAAQIVAHHFVFWHDSLLLVDCHSPLTIRPHTSGRLTVPSEPSSLVNIAIILTIDLAASSGRHTRQRHMPVDRQQRHPVHRYLRRLFSHDFTERRTLKTPSTITASSTTSRRPRVQSPAPHHRLLVSALFHRFPRIVHPRSTQVFHPPR